MTDSRAHVLIVGGGTGLIRRHRPRCRTSVLCNDALVGRVADPAGHVRVTGLPLESPDELWVDAALALHRETPVTAIAAFGEADARRVPAIAAARGLPDGGMLIAAGMEPGPQLAKALAAARRRALTGETAEEAVQNVLRKRQ